MVPTFIEASFHPFAVVAPIDEVIRPMINWCSYLRGCSYIARSSVSDEQYVAFEFLNEKDLDVFLEGCYRNMA